MRIEAQANGDLVMQCEDINERRSLLEDYTKWVPWSITAEQAFVRMWLEDKGYEEVKPEEVGALTGATCIRKGDEVWGDMNYQVRSFVQDLILGKVVRWQRG